MKITRVDKKAFKDCGYQSLPPWPTTGRSEEYVKKLNKRYNFPRFHITRMQGSEYYEIHMDLRRYHSRRLKGTIKNKGQELENEIYKLKIAQIKILVKNKVNKVNKLNNLTKLK